MAGFRPSSLCPLAPAALATCPSISQAWHLMDLPNSGENWHTLALCPNKGSSQDPDCCPFLAVLPQPPTAWIASSPPFHCGTPAGGTSQADGPQKASPLQSQSFQQPGGLPGDHQGRQMVRREEPETHLSICSLDVRWLSMGGSSSHGTGETSSWAQGA